MKKKFLILTLCFTLIFSSLNYRRSYADGVVISLPILATVSSLAVSTGIFINNNDDLYDLGKMFYDYIDEHNDLTWETVQLSFNSAVSVLPNKLVSIDSKFLDIVKGFFDNTFLNSDNVVDYSELASTAIDFFNNYNEGYNYSVTIQNYYSGNYETFYVTSENEISFSFERSKLYMNGTGYYRVLSTQGVASNRLTFPTTSGTQCSSYSVSSLGAFGYSGGYTWDNVDNKKEDDESVLLPIPGNLGQLVGQGSTDFWDNTDDLVGTGDISIPNVDNPSIGLDDVITFPNVSNPDVPDVDDPSIPNDTIWSNITDYIIGLVVPSDTYWTDTWGGLYNNFTSSFPMIDMNGFNDLVTGEKKFPNIDINIMGSNGRVVNGDIVNSIVDWLRPIIAGFMMLCLMFFNYRKLYKLIRNSEPFEGIGKVENHAN